MGVTLTALITNIVIAAAILFGGIWLAKQIKKYVVLMMERRNVDALLASFSSNIVYVALVAFVVIAALSQLGIQTTSFVAIIGAAGLAIGLALQGSLANFASGVMIIAFRPFKDPAPLVAVSELADSSVNFVVRPWASSADYWGVKFDFTEAVKLRFDKEGISIPYPQQDVHLHNVEK